MASVTILSFAASANAGAMTALTMILIAIAALCAIAMIAWGTMRRRVKAGEVAEAEKHAALAGHAPVTVAPTDEPVEDIPDLPPLPAVSSPTAAADQPLTMLKGLGPKAATRLAELGIASVDQLAALSPERISAIDAEMGNFTGRIARDRWVEQARLLAAGDLTGFEKAFGKLGG